MIPSTKGLALKPLSSCGGPWRGKNRTKAQWDYDLDVNYPSGGFSYGEELYAKATENFAKELEASRLDKVNENEDVRKKKRRGKSRGQGSTGEEGSTAKIGAEDKCRDFSTPSFNSSLKTSAELAKAMDNLKNLPEHIERIFKADKRFQPLILEEASKTLNVHRESKVFKDLVSIEPSKAVVEQVSKVISENVQAVRPPSRSRDPEPDLKEYQENTFSRLKPKPVPPPPKPEAGVSVDVDDTLHMVESELKFEEDGNQIKPDSK